MKHPPDSITAPGAGEGQHKNIMHKEQWCWPSPLGNSAPLFTKWLPSYKKKKKKASMRDLSTSAIHMQIHIYTKNKLGYSWVYITVPSKQLEPLQLSRKLISVWYHPNYQLIISSASIQGRIYHFDKAYANFKIGIEAMHTTYESWTWKLLYFYFVTL